MTDIDVFLTVNGTSYRTKGAAVLENFAACDSAVSTTSDSKNRTRSTAGFGPKTLKNLQAAYAATPTHERLAFLTTIVNVFPTLFECQNGRHNKIIVTVRKA